MGIIQFIMEKQLESLYKDRKELDKKITELEYKIKEERCITVDWETLKDIIRDFNNWHYYDSGNSERQDYALCDENGGCASSACDIPACLYRFDTFDKDFSEFDFFIKCQCCYENDYLSIEEVLEDLDTNGWSEETYRLDPQQLSETSLQSLKRKRVKRKRVKRKE